jgi:hypothetical protein
MPLLGGLLVMIADFLIVQFARFFSLRTAWKLATITVVMGLIGALFAAGKACADSVCGPIISGISSSHPSFAVGLGLVFNSTVYAAVSCYITVWTLCQLYVWKRRIIDLFK